MTTQPNGPLCCFPSCFAAGTPAEFEIYGESQLPDDNTQACEAHVGTLLGSFKEPSHQNRSWTVVVHAPQSDPTKRSGTVGTDLGITLGDAYLRPRRGTTRRRRPKWLTNWARVVRLALDPKARRRSNGARKAWVARKRNAEDKRIAENIDRNESARLFKSDPTP